MLNQQGLQASSTRRTGNSSARGKASAGKSLSRTEGKLRVAHRCVGAEEKSIRAALSSSIRSEGRQSYDITERCTFSFGKIALIRQFETDILVLSIHFRAGMHRGLGLRETRICRDKHEGTLLAFYTDFRLAKRLTKQAGQSLIFPLLLRRVTG